jgi:hypothetical protein
LESVIHQARVANQQPTTNNQDTITMTPFTNEPMHSIIIIIMMVLISMQAIMPPVKAFLVPSMTSRASTVHSANTNHRAESLIVRYENGDDTNHLADRVLTVEIGQRHLYDSLDRIERQLTNGFDKIDDRFDKIDDRFDKIDNKIALLVGLTIFCTAQGMLLSGPIIGKAL